MKRRVRIADRPGESRRITWRIAAARRSARGSSRMLPYQHHVGSAVKDPEDFLPGRAADYAVYPVAELKRGPESRTTRSRIDSFRTVEHIDVLFHIWVKNASRWIVIRQRRRCVADAIVKRRPVIRGVLPRRKRLVIHAGVVEHREADLVHVVGAFHPVRRVP